jgi:hypothetical protein
MDKNSALRVRMIKSKKFLKSLYQNVDTLLNNSSQYEMRTLYLILYQICNGFIPIHKDDFLKLEEGPLNLIKKKIEKRINLKKILSQTLTDQRILIKSFLGFMPMLLKPLFQKNISKFQNVL